MAKDGLIISEYAPEELPLHYHFLERNRIVAALSKGVVLVEAKEGSGSLTTIKYAKNLKKDLFVFPGSALNANYLGSNKLIAAGSKCVLDYKDILKAYKISNTSNETEKIKEAEIPQEYIKIYESILKEPKNVNQISIELNIPISTLNSKLTIMEMEGYIRCLPGKIFIKNY